MGTLRDFRLADFGCNVFFETGMGRGDSLKYALQGNFQRLFSVEIDFGTYLRFGLPLRLRWFLRDLSVINSESATALNRYLPEIPKNDRILFFLDAHYPGERSANFAGYKAEPSKDRRLPLERELEIIARCRPDCRDVIIVDDLRIYEDGPFESGNMPEWAETLSAAEKNVDFVNRLFSGRPIRRDFRREGYLIIGFAPA